MRVVIATLIALCVVAPAAGARSAQRSAPFTIFPVLGGASYVDDFGDSRGQGSHEGNDLMAPCGTEALAVVDGRIDVSYGSRSGWMITLYGARNWYRYIHMQGPNKRRVLPKGLRDGARVKEGQVIGYVGNTGDASYAPCHLHFELHTNARRVLNPYRWLRRATILERDPAQPDAAPQAKTATLSVRGRVAWYAEDDRGSRLAVRATRVRAKGADLERTPRVVIVRVPETLREQAAALSVGTKVSLSTEPATVTQALLECRPLRWTAAGVTVRRR